MTVWFMNDEFEVIRKEIVKWISYLHDLESTHNRDGEDGFQI
jgi:hypothetical protein